MIIIGADILHILLEGEALDAKMVFNRRGAVLFPSRLQHRDMKAEGISYEDNYRGNALAAMLRRDAIEVRFHTAYSDAQVAALLRELLLQPEFERFTLCQATYQGRRLLS